MEGTLPHRKMHPMFFDTFNYFDSVPDTTREALWNYMAYGYSPGGFLEGVITNNFLRATSSADHTWNSRSFKDLGKWIMTKAPPESYGSIDTMNEWMRKSDNERLEIMVELRLRPSVIDILAGYAEA